MKRFTLEQGSDAWHALRARCNTASEAPVMASMSSKMRRNELLHMKATGSAREVSEWVQKNLFDKGHAVEAKARALAEEIIGEELYPVTATDDDEYLLASFDGLTMLDDATWEHKMWNAEKAAIVASGKIPDEDFMQVVQQLVVSRADKCLYMVSDGTKENCVHTWYSLQDGDEARLLAGWRQFDEDRAAYVPPEVAEEVVAKAVDNLPSVAVSVSGAISLKHNFDVFEAALTEFLEEKLVRDPKTDQDFADLDLQIKALKKAETALEAAEAQMLAQVESVDTAKRRKDALLDLTKKNRLMAEKLLAAKKEQVRADIKRAAEDNLAEYIQAANRRLTGARLPTFDADFAGAIRNKRTIDSLRNAVDSELARVKILVTGAADLVAANLAVLDAQAPEHKFLFADLQQIANKPTEDFVALVKVRLSEHAEKERKRLDAERERIRLEEQEKLAEQNRKAEAERIAEEARKAGANWLAEQANRLAEQVGKANQAAKEAEKQPEPAAEKPAPVQEDMIAATEAVVTRPARTAPIQAPKRPTDQEILEVISAHYQVSIETAIDWLAEMDLTSDVL